MMSRMIAKVITDYWQASSTTATGAVQACANCDVAVHCASACY